MIEPLPIAVDHLTKRFGTRTVLDRVSLAIAPRQTVALVGPSGSGKSTLLRCLNGLCAFDAGQIRVGPHVLHAGDGRARRAEARRVRSMLGMIFQDFQLFGHLTALGNVIEAPRRVLGLTKDEAKRRGTELLDRVGLADRAAAYPAELSGGQKQRVAIARAMAMSPRGLLCDEITSALDPELKGEVLAVLEDLKRDGLTLVLVTHEMAFARRSADRVVVLADGAILEDGPPSVVLDHPQTTRAQRFLSRVMT
ncbi:MAG: amino acid ABC transporter ATP-binding protein [Thermoguttaceae bacterium]|jgi:polar amino acid transport system ATP-binding protein|nr:amino acid ABC transporter ATP-binding protein [Thermoguttaceae bacterium]